MKRPVLLLATVLLPLAAGAGGPVSQKSACQERFAALCSVMLRCSVAAEDLGTDCQAIDPGCERLSGSSRFDAAAVDACVRGLRTLTCTKKADPNDAEAMDFESKVAACRSLASDADRTARARR